MKTILIMTVMGLSLSTTVFADTKIDTITCNQLKSAVSTKIFTRATVVGRLKIKKMDSDRNVGYFDTVNYDLNKDLEKYCASNNSTIESLIKYQDKTCKSHCSNDKDLKKKRGLLDQDPIYSEAEVAYQVCSSLCEEGADKLKIFKLGADSNTQTVMKTSPDCAGAVADSGRNKSKVIDHSDDQIGWPVRPKANIQK